MENGVASLQWTNGDLREKQQQRDSNYWNQLDRRRSLNNMMNFSFRRYVEASPVGGIYDFSIWYEGQLTSSRSYMIRASVHTKKCWLLLYGEIDCDVWIWDTSAIERIGLCLLKHDGIN